MGAKPSGSGGLLLPIVDETHQILWCPYCPERQPVFMSRDTDELAKLNARFGRHYTLIESCSKCGTAWLCEPVGNDSKRFTWDVYAYGKFRNLIPRRSSQGFICPYCTFAETPLFLLPEEAVISLGKKYGAPYLQGLRCSRCKSIWLGRELDNLKGEIFWDTLQGVRIDSVSMTPTTPAFQVALTGLGGELKEGRTYIIDTKEATKGHLVVLGERHDKNRQEKKGFWNRLKGS